MNQEHYLMMRGKLLNLVCFSLNKSRQFEYFKVLRNGLVTSFWILILLSIWRHIFDVSKVHFCVHLKRKKWEFNKDHAILVTVKTTQSKFNQW